MPSSDLSPEDRPDGAPSNPDGPTRGPDLSGTVPEPPLTAVNPADPDAVRADLPVPPYEASWEPEGPPVLLPPKPPGPPHPSFWWAILWCLLFLMVTQVAPALAIAVVAVVVVALREGMDYIGTEAGMAEVQGLYLMPAIIAAQVCGVLFSWLALRLVAGRDWPRQVALRLPSLTHLILVVLGFPALPILASGAYLLAKQLPGLPDILAVFVSLFLALGLVWPLLRVAFGPGWGQELAAQPLPRQTAYTVSGTFVVLALTAALFGLLSPYLFRFDMDSAGFMEEMVKEFRKWPPWLAVLAIGVGPGLSEELWCRGFLGRGLLGTYGIALGVALTSLLFGLIHGDPHQGTMAALMGVVLHYTYITTRSLLVPMLLHFLNNSLSVLAAHLPEEVEKIDAAPDQINWLIYLAAGVLMLAVAWALYRGRARLVSADGGEPLWRPRTPGVEHPPEGSGAVVVRPWPGAVPVALFAAAFLWFAVVFTVSVVRPDLLP